MVSPKTEARLLTAKWALPVCAEPIQNAALVCRRGVIEAICRADKLSDFYSSAELVQLKQGATDYKDAVITPGLVNLHTHLDYSLLGELYADTEPSMFEWLPKLVQTSWSWTPEQWTASARHGVAESLIAGTSCLVDNSFTGQSARVLAQTGMRALVGLELFGQDESLAEAAWQRWLDKYERVSKDSDAQLQSALANGLIQLTVAPHSPYTVAPALWKLAKNWADARHKPLLAHLAESTQECAWIYGTDETLDKYLQWVRELQARAGIVAYNNIDPPPTPWRGHQQTPCQLLEENGLFNEHLIATHLVQVDDDDIELLQRYAVSVVHCARSNMRLKHGLAPLQKFAASGLRVGLGTDSLASAPDLSMIKEGRAVMQLHSAAEKSNSIDAATALRMITLDAAKILGMSDKIGSLEQNKSADLAVFQYNRRADFEGDLQPADLLFSLPADCVTVYVEGRLITALP